MSANNEQDQFNEQKSDMHWYIIQILTGLTIDTTGYPLELLLNSNWISNGFSFVFH